MTIPSLPEEQPPPFREDDDEAMPTVIPQSVMTAVSVIMILALILGSATAILALTDWGINVAAIAGLAVALLLAVMWMGMTPRSRR
jgi:membrane protein YdbS with pleckstrin-like domain